MPRRRSKLHEARAVKASLSVVIPAYNERATITKVMTDAILTAAE